MKHFRRRTFKINNLRRHVKKTRRNNKRKSSKFLMYGGGATAGCNCEP